MVMTLPYLSLNILTIPVPQLVSPLGGVDKKKIQISWALFLYLKIELIIRSRVEIVMRAGSEVGPPGFKSWFCHLLAV